MREILFRGKRKINKEWIYGDYFRSKIFNTELGIRVAHSITYYHNDIEHSHVVDPSTIGQYTGLTDKNGKKIFEGDIVVVPLSGKPAKGIVEYFKTDICGFVVITQPQYSNYVLQKNYTYEVIGNIHDNPELLKDKS